MRLPSQVLVWATVLASIAEVAMIVVGFTNRIKLRRKYNIVVRFHSIPARRRVILLLLACALRVRCCTQPVRCPEVYAVVAPWLATVAASDPAQVRQLVIVLSALGHALLFCALQGNECEDCLLHTFCICCAISQVRASGCRWFLYPLSCDLASLLPACCVPCRLLHCRAVWRLLSACDVPVPRGFSLAHVLCVVSVSLMRRRPATWTATSASSTCSARRSRACKDGTQARTKAGAASRRSSLSWASSFRLVETLCLLARNMICALLCSFVFVFKKWCVFGQVLPSWVSLSFVCC